MRHTVTVTEKVMESTFHKNRSCGIMNIVTLKQSECKTWSL